MHLVRAVAIAAGAAVLFVAWPGGAWAADGPPPLQAAQAVQAVHEAIHQRFVLADDLATWGRTDHWATPGELAATGQGDCEDLAIAKYFALRAAGVPDDRLRLAYAHLRIGDSHEVVRAHMVLAYLPPGAEALILDSLLVEVRPVSRRPDLDVLLSFNAEGIWPGLARGLPVREPGRLVSWQRLLDRVAAAE